ncbi:F-box/kelch-repeat protein-like [Dorcoceras hygrometricum]|uniref:F-box/kelch-repeat protein-like n=1 Tax=Dorcoceras hygrometricum TaxID=472368 RepID=A0A2Z7DBR0_9LAMI|nr:F-box/kelch-repeat protein-like [Dorcoceras hygrometricum]
MELIPGLPDDVGLECLIRICQESFPCVASVCRKWKDTVRGPEFWQRRKAANLAQKVVVLSQAKVGDFGEEPGNKKHSPTQVYRLTLCEPETGRWAQLPPMPDQTDDGLPMFCQLVGVGRNLVLIGGWDPRTWEVSNDVFVYNFVSAKWRRGATMPGCRRSFFACASDGRRFVYVAGGHDGEKSALKSAMAYDLTEDLWVMLPEMEKERDEPAGIFHHDKFYVVGGYVTSMQGRFETSAEAFDVPSWQWGSDQENFLNSSICPRNCIDDADGRLYVSCSGHVAALQGSEWKGVVELPHNVQNTTHMTACRDKAFVMASSTSGGRHQMFILDLKSYRWEKVEATDDFSGHVQSGCCLEL